MEPNDNEAKISEDETSKGWASSITEFLSLDEVVLVQDEEALNNVLEQDTDDDIYVLYVDETLSKKDSDLSKKTFEYFAIMARDEKANNHFIIMDIKSLPEIKNELELDCVKIFHYKQKQIQSRDVLIDDPLQCLSSSASKSVEEIIVDGMEELRLESGDEVSESEAETENLEGLELEAQTEAENLEGLELEAETEAENLNESESKAENTQAEEYQQSPELEKSEEEIVHNREEPDFEKKVMNVLILGQSGVGKSTWVNSIFNYLQYDTLENAEKGEVICVIPSKFTVSYMTDKKVESQMVQIGDDDENEITATGKSATQDPKTYRFVFGDRKVHLIDTPGLGDTRGIEYDKENMKKILDHINGFDEIHGIVIFMKSNETRIGAVFRFCIMELLTNLHKSAAKNILFCFTNSRGSFYSPGDTTAVLENLLKELNLGNTISLCNKTMFCMDNEAFRFLCTLKYKNIHRTPEDRKSYESSWVQSVAETKRMFQQIKELTPHIVTDTTTLCKARNRILFLTKPLAEIQMTIQMNLSAIADEERRLENSKLSLDELAKKLYMPHIELRAEALNYPRTVCVNKSCVKYYHLDRSGIMLTEYTQICHDHCYLKNVATDSYPQSELRNCHAMNCGRSTECRYCGCSWEKHMHITYDQKRVETVVLNSEVVNEIRFKKTSKQKIQAHKRYLEKKMKQYEEEQRAIIQTSLKFGVFLRENAITPYNDGFKDYLKYLIEQEKNKVNKTQIDDDILNKLNEMMRRYEEEVKILEESMKNSNVGQNFTPEDIHNLELDLYKLKLTGKEIKRNVEMSLAGSKRAQKGLETYVPINRQESKPNIVRKFFSGVGRIKNYFFYGRFYEPRYNEFF